MRRLAIVLAAVLLVACGSSTPSAPSGAPVDLTPAPDREERSSEERQGCRSDCAPDFAVTSFEGERFSLAEQRGTPVVINFFESW